MKSLFLLAACISCTQFSHAVEVHEPKSHILKSVEFNSIDEQVKTLGAVEFIIDLGASRDDVFELSARRKGLTLEDGREITVFGYNKEAGVIIGSVAPVSYVSVTGADGGKILAQFFDEKNEIIAPSTDQIQVFDLNFKPLEFEYTPALAPKGIAMDVSLLIDVSGSMQNALNDVTRASRDFLSALPDFTRCSVLTFGSTVERLTNVDPAKRKSCPESLSVLDAGLVVNGATALHRAIKDALEDNKASESKLPKLTIILTDGQDTENPEISVDKMNALKKDSNSKILIFWAGSYSPDYLKGLADIESVSGNHITSDLEEFFRSIGISINGLQTITIK
tara:strand:- start:487 stop:1497 length:1011 start_codon:yes stop_codon:yes gene_type:complete